MATVDRRRFLQVGGVGAGLGVALPSAAFGSALATIGAAPDTEERLVRLGGDGLGLTPAQYAGLLTRLLEEKAMTPDSYSLGGVVEELESAFARCSARNARSSCPPARSPITWRCARWPAGRAA